MYTCALPLTINHIGLLLYTGELKFPQTFLPTDGKEQEMSTFSVYQKKYVYVTSLKDLFENVDNQKSLKQLYSDFEIYGKQRVCRRIQCTVCGTKQ